ncbi:PH domain-containing protein [Natrarchaeobius halalkaliphilus]|uniref:PH domain-containing protein n=1 Tax=Natrarchaeobius halalkaliphilus TaxID=1679091 RepID=A0A3N6MX07_9EURY|nr:PH domain-containing protein [Natrarchaeobius halalkaliphilus]RQG90022.1 PH domain-containing protein [Natrarchaeobius halalkaliphilus]
MTDRSRSNNGRQPVSGTGPSHDLQPSTEAHGSLEWLALIREGGSAPGETIVWRDGPRMQTAYPWGALALVGVLVPLVTIALDIFSALALVWAPVVSIPAVWGVLRIARTEYVLTSRRVAIRRGVLGISVETVDLERVQNTTLTQHSVARIVGYGTVTIEAASGETFTLRNVEKPDAVRNRLEAQRELGRSTDVPGAIEQWEAVLEEIRGLRRTIDPST